MNLSQNSTIDEIAIFLKISVPATKQRLKKAGINKLKEKRMNGKAKPKNLYCSSEIVDCFFKPIDIWEKRKYDCGSYSVCLDMAAKKNLGWPGMECESCNKYKKERYYV